MRRLGILMALLVAAPAQGAVVARDGDLALVAKRKGNEVCLTLRGSEEPVGRRCERSPASPFRPVFLDAFGEAGPLAAAVPDRVREVEVDGRRVDTTTAPGLRERFFLLADADPTALLRFYDESGALIAAARSEFARLVPQRRGAVVLHRAGVRVRAQRDLELRPDPLRVDHTIPSTCYAVEFGNGSSGTCLADRDIPPLLLEVNRRCAPAPPVLTGLVAPAIRRVELVLGSGRRLRVPTSGLPVSFGEPFRLVAAKLPPGEALRSARGLDAMGRTRGRSSLRAAPGSEPCDDGISESSSSYGRIFGGADGAQGRGAAVASVAGHRLFAGDSRAFASVCVAFDRPRTGCQPAPVDSPFFALSRAGNAVGGVLAADVASVRLELDRGGPLEVPTTDGAAYEGRFAGRLRFLAVRVPAGREVRNAIALDAAGRRLGRGFVLGTLMREVVARIPPALAVQRTDGGVEGYEASTYCLRAPGVNLFAAFSSCRGRFGGAILVTASCAPRRLLLYGYLPRGVRGADVIPSGGPRAAARVLRLGPEAGGGRVFTYVLPRGEGLRAVVYSERPPRPFRHAERPDRRVAFELPPATEQCGYDESTEPF